MSLRNHAILFERPSFFAQLPRLQGVVACRYFVAYNFYAGVIRWLFLFEPGSGKMQMKSFFFVFLMVAVTTVCLYSQGSQKAPEVEGTLKVSVDLVNVVFAVSESNNRFVSNLSKEDFLVEEDGKPQNISYFAKEVTLPLTLGLLIDTSPSVAPVLEMEESTAIDFLQTVLRKQDLALIMNFDRGVTLLQDFTSDLRRLERAIRSVSIGGGTSVHDAIFLASDEKLKGETGRKAIILISDGGDTTSKVKMKESLEAAQRADIIIFAISTPVVGPLMMGGGDPGTLKKYCDATGGRAFFPSKPQDFKKCFDAIQDELRSQYVISYTSTNTARDGSFRSIKISVLNQKGLKVRAKKGYYAPRS